jgi:ribose 1,5-bisphosphokinase
MSMTDGSPIDGSQGKPVGPAASAGRQPRAGRLVLVVGPSGAGKDSVLGWVRGRLESESALPPVRFAQRIITRPADAGAERHVPVDRARFEQLRDEGAFALWWSANGHSYGVGSEIRSWLQAGETVVVSASRAHLPQALCAFPRSTVVLITASASVIRERLLERGRESREEVDARLARGQSLALPPDIDPVEIVNDGELAKAGRRLLAVLSPALPAIDRPAQPKQRV